MMLHDQRNRGTSYITEDGKKYETEEAGGKVAERRGGDVNQPGGIERKAIADQHQW